jgi:hypothetical protein
LGTRKFSALKVFGGSFSTALVVLLLGLSIGDNQFSLVQWFEVEALSSVEFFFGCSFLGCFLFGVPDQARLGLDALPAHATSGKGGVTSDWLCM